MDKKLLSLLSHICPRNTKDNGPVSAYPPKDTLRLMERASRCIGEAAALIVFHGKGNWNYFFGRFGVASAWLHPTSPACYRQIPARLFANAIVCYRRQIECFPNSVPAAASLNELELIRLWIFLMIEPDYTVLQGLLSHALLRKLPFCQPVLWIGKLLPAEEILPLCESSELLRKNRKAILYVFLKQLAIHLLPKGTVPDQSSLTLFHNLLNDIPRRLVHSIVKELPEQLSLTGSGILLEHIAFSFSVVGQILTRCTFLLYRPQVTHSLLPTLIVHFFKNRALDLPFRLR